jgi:CrcB protein
VTVLVWVGVAAFGGVGALARFLVDGIVSTRAGRELPFGTLVVNVSGALLLGLVAGLALSGDALLLIGTAVLGSYTTFSTWLLETHRLGEDSELFGAVGNSLVSVAVGFGAIALGRAIGG